VPLVLQVTRPLRCCYAGLSTSNFRLNPSCTMTSTGTEGSRCRTGTKRAHVVDLKRNKRAVQKIYS
jgi:hypothetical protein